MSTASVLPNPVRGGVSDRNACRRADREEEIESLCLLPRAKLKPKNRLAGFFRRKKSKRNRKQSNFWAPKAKKPKRRFSHELSSVDAAPAIPPRARFQPAHVDTHSC